MGQYEYLITRIETFSNTEASQMLDRFSADGWELIFHHLQTMKTINKTV
jgi:hypothetical protein